jgi:hypothetical protein
MCVGYLCPCADICLARKWGCVVWAISCRDPFTTSRESVRAINNMALCVWASSARVMLLLLSQQYFRATCYTVP